MKFLLDENVPGFLAKKFIKRYPDSIYVREDNRLQGKSDEEIYKYLCGKQRILVSFDSDFSNKMIFPPGPTGGIIVIRSKGIKEVAAVEKLLMFLSVMRPGSLKGTLTILKKASIRTRKF